ncbi:hypothetical protein ACFB49_37860 [Sphingomonas sp. DBB INV C78]|uniref:peptidoglycan-associated lipoprotein Pal n=1 Tax=Sphingomonas sp. DBB INV C78 TaxID=3349434 RepID=UPI0036D2BAEC
MQNLTTKLLVAAAFVAVAGCAKKPPETLPPAPTETAPPAQTTQPEGPVGSTVVPGSKEDFLQQVGSDRVLFDTDKYDLNDEARATLDRQAQWLAKYPNVRITIEGHADERGTREYNLALGDRRANSAKNYFASRIDAARISTVSYGKERPEVPGSDESAWAQNRRAVTVVITGM